MCQVDECGVCHGTGVIDGAGECCAGGVLGADGDCCVSGEVDMCGVCDGTGRTCSLNVAAVASLAQDATELLPQGSFAWCVARLSRVAVCTERWWGHMSMSPTRGV